MRSVSNKLEIQKRKRKSNANKSETHSKFTSLRVYVLSIIFFSFFIYLSYSFFLLHFLADKVPLCQAVSLPPFPLAIHLPSYSVSLFLACFFILYLYSLPPLYCIRLCFKCLPLQGVFFTMFLFHFFLSVLLFFPLCFSVV